MKRKVRSGFWTCVWVGFFLTAAVAHAGGVWLYEEATPDMGVGGAGRQAAGFDASTASGNPAAMTRLDRIVVKVACRWSKSRQDDFTRPTIEDFLTRVV